MNILFYVSEKLSGHGGMESVIKEVYKSLKRRKHIIEIVLAEESVNSSWEKDIQVKHLLNFHPKYANQEHKVNLQVQKLKEITFGRNTDIIVCLSAFSLKIAKTLVSTFELPVYVLSWIHFSIHKEKYKKMLGYADGHLCISSEIKDQLRNETPNIHSELIFNPVDVDQKTISKSKHPVFVYVGRLDNEQKRVDVLLKALVHIKGEWELMIIGDGNDKLMLNQLSKELRINSKVKWYGWSVDPWSLVKEASVLILPSDYEGFGLVLVEALCRGLPVISSDCSTGPKDIVQHGVNGWLFDPGDINQLSRLIEKFVEESAVFNPNVCVESVQHFNSENFGENFENALINLTKN